MENPVYHVLLEGRKVGPYDRRTIVGMRVKKTLDSKSVLLGSDGTRITVADLVHQAGDSREDRDRDQRRDGQPDTGEHSDLERPEPGCDEPRAGAPLIRSGAA